MGLDDYIAKQAVNLLLSVPIDDCDGDLVPDAIDNCVWVANSGQGDSDSDGTGNLCECGDASADGRLETVDARLIQRCSVGEIPCAGLCDVNCDRLCNTIDARLIQRFAVGHLAKGDLYCAARPVEEVFPASGCGLGYELGALLAPLAWLRHKRGRGRA